MSVLFIIFVCSLFCSKANQQVTKESYMEIEGIPGTAFNYWANGYCGDNLSGKISARGMEKLGVGQGYSVNCKDSAGLVVVCVEVQGFFKHTCFTFEADSASPNNKVSLWGAANDPYYSLQGNVTMTKKFSNSGSAPYCECYIKGPYLKVQGISGTAFSYWARGYCGENLKAPISARGGGKYGLGETFRANCKHGAGPVVVCVEVQGFFKHTCYTFKANSERGDNIVSLWGAANDPDYSVQGNVKMTKKISRTDISPGCNCET